MLYGNVKQFQLYDQLLIQQKQWDIENMVFEAAKALHKYINTNKKVIIVCGKGNNGADGLALATLLKDNVTIYLLDDENNLSQSSIYYLHQVRQLNIEVKSDINGLKRDLIHCDIIVDAIFGTGFNGELPSDILEIVRIINTFKNDKEIISIDIPSGLDANLGIVLNDAIKADITITFLAHKIGFLNPDSNMYTGKVIVEDILYDSQIHDIVCFSQLLPKEYFCDTLKPRLYYGYKGTYGTLSCYVGSQDYPGAALLSVGSALHTGCGYVQYVGDKSVKNHLIPCYPEVIYSNSVKKTDAILFGCGKGWNESTASELKQLIETSTVPLLIDADGINCLSEHPEWLTTKKSSIILTPHVGEMNRINEGDSVLSAIEFSKKYDVIIVLKGANTMVVDANHSVRIPSGNKAMAVAGMGDCLSGIIASLLAQHYDPFDACCLGVYIHGCCGDVLANNNYTVLPSQMISMIPQIMKSIEKRTNLN